MVRRIVGKLFEEALVPVVSAALPAGPSLQTADGYVLQTPRSVTQSSSDVQTDHSDSAKNSLLNRVFELEKEQSSEGDAQSSISTHAVAGSISS